jgi:hypothetical protein
MDLRKEILKEHSKAQTTKLVTYVGGNPKRFSDLFVIYLEGPYVVTQRAAWSIAICVENHPELIKPHLIKAVNMLKKPGVHPAVKRNTLRLLQFIELPKKLYGTVANCCFEFLQDTKEPVAIKALSITILSKIIRDEPELQRELRLILEDQMPYASPAFTSRARKVLTIQPVKNSIKRILPL